MAERQTARRSRGETDPTPGKSPQSLPDCLSRGPSGGFDRLVHERVRLGVLSALAVNKSLSFGDLKQLLKTTDGNLSVHARKLEEADYIVCTKSFEKRLPHTEYQLSAKGRKALTRYLDHMEALIHATRGE